MRRLIRNIISEFKKLQLKKIGMSILVILTIQFLWELRNFSSLQGANFEQGWKYLLYSMPPLNALLMPIITAIIASRFSDIEHKGEMFKLLNTITPASHIFCIKFINASIFLIVIVLIQTLFLGIAGWHFRFPGEIPFERLSYYLIFTLFVNITIQILHLDLSLLFKNQVISLAAGIVGGLVGLYLLFLPPQIASYFVWGYYGKFMLVGMNWEETSKHAMFYDLPINWYALIPLSIFCIFLYDWAYLL